MINGFAYSSSGSAVSSAGDFNGDGYDDLLVAASGGNGYSSYTMGESGIIGIFFGGINPGPTLDFSYLDGTNGFILAGPTASNYAGESASSIGDHNGDGFDDILIGAPYADPNGNDKAGESYIIYGSAEYGQSNTQQTSNGTGTASAENFVGTKDDDTFTGLSTDDTVSAGAGNDSITIDDANFFRIDGGSGIDTLVFGGSDINLDLTNVANLNKLEDIQAIDMGDSNGTSTLSLTLDQLLDLPGSRNYAYDSSGGISTDDNVSGALRIMGDSGDTLELVGFEAWQLSPVTIDGIELDFYVAKNETNATFLVDQGINIVQ